MVPVQKPVYKVVNLITASGRFENVPLVLTDAQQDLSAINSAPDGAKVPVAVTCSVQNFCANSVTVFSKQDEHSSKQETKVTYDGNTEMEGAHTLTGLETVFSDMYQNSTHFVFEGYPDQAYPWADLQKYVVMASQAEVVPAITVIAQGG